VHDGDLGGYKLTKNVNTTESNCGGGGGIVVLLLLLLLLLVVVVVVMVVVMVVVFKAVGYRTHERTNCRIGILLVKRSARSLSLLSKQEQDRQCRYNETLRRVSANILQWKSNKYFLFWVCVGSFRYPTRNARLPYCPPWPIRFYVIFPHYLINSTIFEKKVIKHKMCVLIFSINFVCNISH